MSQAPNPPLGTNEDPERDAWLTQALRHAPDADAAAPSGLRDAILRQAHAVATSSRTAAAAATRASSPGIANRLWAAWSWLARPPVAAGFASVMLATLVGVMWWGRPMDETLSRPPEPSLPQAAASPGLEAQSAAPAPAPALAPAPAPARAGATRPPAQPAPPDMAAAGERMRDIAPSGAQAPAVRNESVAAEAQASGHIAAKAAARRTSVSEPLAIAQTSPLTELLASIAEQSQRWRWQRDASARAMTPNLQRWLLQLDNAAAAQWRATAGPGPQGSGLRVYFDTDLRGTVSVDTEGVWFTAPGAAGSTWRAALPPEALATLKRALDDATP